jgi:HlyD family secretion protein
MQAILRHPLIAVATLATIALVGWGLWPAPVPVETTLVRRAPLTVTIEEEGHTRVIDRYTISAPVDGVACRINLDVGDPVTEGELLLTVSPLESQVLDPRSRAQAEARVKAAEAALLAARQQANAAAAAAELAQSDLDRLKPLVGKKLVSRDAFDKATTAVTTTAAAKRSADFGVDVAQYELQAATSVLEYAGSRTSDSTQRVPVTSPIDGKILKIVRKCEGPVRTGNPMLEVGDPSALEVEVDVLSADAVKIKPGMSVEFDRWGGDHPLKGIVRTVEPVAFTKVSTLGVEEQRVLIISDFTSPRDEWRSLGDGYRVEAKFTLWHGDDVLQVPASSLFRYRNGWAMFTIDKGRAKRRMVTVGERNGLTAQILDGAAAGTVVINHPSEDVDDGRRVRLQ